jgi:hypothetical protein
MAMIDFAWEYPEPAPKPALAFERVVRPMFKVPTRGGKSSRWFRSEWQVYLFLARRVVGWVRDHYQDERNECRLCAKEPCRGIDEDGRYRGCRYHDDRSYRRLVDRVATAIRRNDRRRALAFAARDCGVLGG